MKMYRYKISLNFTIPLPEARFADSLAKEAAIRLVPMLGRDLVVHTEIKVVKKAPHIKNITK